MRPSARAGMDRVDKVRLAWTLLAVLAVHLAVAALASDGVIRDDAESYVLIAHSLSTGEGFVFGPGRAPTSWRAPGYPVLLSLVFRADPDGLGLARVVNALLWTLTALWAFFLGRRIASTRAGLLAAGFVGLYPEFLGLTGLLWSETLFICLFTAAVLCTVATLGEKSGPWPLLAGVALGLAALTRSTAIVAVPVILLVAASQRSWRRLGRALVLCAVALAVMGTWTLRNYTVHGRPILVESNAGFNVFMGNCAFTPTPFAWKVLANPEAQNRVAELTAGLSESDSNATLTEEGVQYIRTHPGQTSLRALGKLVDFWLPDFFVARNVASGALGPRWSRGWVGVLAVTTITYLVTVIAAIPYGWRNWRRWDVALLLLLLAAYTAPHMLVYGASRYHLPLMPFVIVLAAAGVVRWREGAPALGAPHSTVVGSPQSGRSE